jgi:hypothetical protein
MCSVYPDITYTPVFSLLRTTAGFGGGLAAISAALISYRTLPAAMAAVYAAGFQPGLLLGMGPSYGQCDDSHVIMFNACFRRHPSCI